MRIDSNDILGELERLDKANADLQHGIARLQRLIDSILTRQAIQEMRSDKSTIRVPDTLQV